MVYIENKIDSNTNQQEGPTTTTTRVTRSGNDDNLSRQLWIKQMKNRRKDYITFHTEKHIIQKAIKETPEIFFKNSNLKFQNDWLSIMPYEDGVVEDEEERKVGLVDKKTSCSCCESPYCSRTTTTTSGNKKKVIKEKVNNIPVTSPTTPHKTITTTTRIRTLSNSSNKNNEHINQTTTTTPENNNTSIMTGTPVSEDEDKFRPLPEFNRRYSFTRMMNDNETQTPIAYGFLRHTVGLEELRNHLRGFGSSVNDSMTSEEDELTRNDNKLKHSNDLLSKFIHPRSNKYKDGISESNPYHMKDDYDESLDSKHDDESNTLIDSLFLAGPDENEVNDYIDSVLDDCFESLKTPPTMDDMNLNTDIDKEKQLSSSSSRRFSVDSVAMANYSRQTNNKLQQQVHTFKKTHPSIAADMIFLSIENPFLDKDVLPTFCFPHGIETTVAILPKKVVEASPMKRIPSPRYVDKQRILFQTKTRGGSNSCNRFIFILPTNQFGICMTIPRIVTLERRNKSIKVKSCYCLAILTRYPFFSFFFQVLTEYVNMKGLSVDSTSFVSKQTMGELLEYELRHLEIFAMKLYQHPIPQPGDSSIFSFTMNMIRREMILKRMSITDRTEEDCMGTLLWALPILLKNFELDLILEVIGCLLTENYVLVRCNKLDVLSACVLSFVYLLRPLKWECPKLVSLPTSMLEMLESPCPYLFGVEATPPSFVMMSGLIVVDPDQRVIHWHPSDLVTKKALSMPKASKLQQQLKPIVDNILKLTKKLKKKKLLSLSSNEFDSGPSLSSSIDSGGGRKSTSFISSTENNSSADSNDESVDDQETNYRPLSLPNSVAFGGTTVPEDDFVQSPLLASAIASFSTAVSQHIQKVAMTAMQMKWKLYNTKLQQKADLASVPREPVTAVNKQMSSDDSVHSDTSTIFSNDNTAITSGSVPPRPPPPGAVWFSQQELGSGGVTFMQSVIKSQMFSKFMEEEDNRVAKEAADISKRNEGIEFTHNDRNDSDDDSSLEGSIKPLVESKSDVEFTGDNKQQQLPRATNSPSDRRKSESTYTLLPDYTDAFDQTVETPRKDPLISLFSIMLTGSYQMSQSKLDDLVKSYHKIYARESSEEELSVNKIWTDSSDYPLFMEDTSHIEESLLCNGRCDGNANTPSCTNICLELWEQKAQLLRRQASVIDIMRRRGSVLAPCIKQTTSRNNKKMYPNSSTGKSGKGKTDGEFRNALPRRHKNETIAQYAHRTSLITGRSEADILEEYNLVNLTQEPHRACSPDKGHSSSKNNPQCHQSPRTTSTFSHTNILPRHLQFKEVVSAMTQSTTTQKVSDRFKQNKISPAVASLVANRRKKINEKQKTTILELTTKAVILIQKEIRGFIVRNNIATIVTSLLLRKKQALEQRQRTKSVGDEEMSIDDHGEDDDIIELRGSQDTETILNQSDHQFYADDLVSAGSDLQRTSEERRCRSLDPKSSDFSPISDATHASSEQYLLNGLLPAGKKRDKSLSLSPSSIFSRGRVQRRSRPFTKKSSPAGGESRVGILRSKSDGCFPVNESASSMGTEEEEDNISPLDEERKQNLSRLLSAISYTTVESVPDSDDEVKIDTTLKEVQEFDVLSPAPKTPTKIHRSKSDDGSDLFVFDESSEGLMIKTYCYYELMMSVFLL